MSGYARACRAVAHGLSVAKPTCRRRWARQGRFACCLSRVLGPFSIIDRPPTTSHHLHPPTDRPPVSLSSPLYSVHIVDDLFLAIRPPSTAAARRHNKRHPSRPTRCFALFAFLPRPPVCRLHTHTRTRKRTRSSPLILIASSARAHKPSRPTPHLSPPPVANRSRQAAPFLHSTSCPKPDTQASPGVDSIEQEAVNHTAATISVHLVAPHTDRQRFPHQ